MPEKKSDNNNFFENVYSIARLIPYGKVTTYGAIAKYLGSARSARMVGWAMNNSHSLKEPVPAHRVVNRNGMLTGKRHFDGNNIMKELLESEGIEIINDKICNFDKYFWEPTNIEI